MITKIGLSTLVMALILTGCGEDSNEKISEAISGNGNSSEYTVVTTSELTQNNPDTFAPKIASFKVVGNSAIQDGKAVVSKSKNGGKFSYSVTLKDSIYANRLYTALDDGSRSVIVEYEFGMSKTLDFDCKLNSIGEDGTGIDYSCGDISLDNTTGKADTHLTAYVCDDTEEKCSKSLIPILFVE